MEKVLRLEEDGGQRGGQPALAWQPKATQQMVDGDMCGAVPVSGNCLRMARWRAVSYVPGAVTLTSRPVRETRKSALLAASASLATVHTSCSGEGRPG